MRHDDFMYKNIAILLLNGKTMDDVIDLFGIDEFYIYGSCRIAELFLENTKHFVKGILDRDVTKQGMMYTTSGDSPARETKIFPLVKSSNDSIPIIIMLGSEILNVRKNLIEMGIAANRIYSFNLMLCIGAQLSMKRDNIDWPSYNISNREFCLITGTRFGNRGSQAMMLTACSEIRKRYPGSVVFCILNYVEQEYEKDYSNYNILFITDGYEEGSTIDELAIYLSLIVDAGGYVIASKGAVNGTSRSMRYMKLAYENCIPMYLLPQSYGPLDYNEEKKKQLDRCLKSVRKIYAREKEGFELMHNTFGLNNLYLAEDIVLTHDISEKEVYFDTYKVNENTNDLDHSVAIIPNIQGYKYGDKSNVLMYYQHIVRWLLCRNKNIYLIVTSEDKGIGLDIYNSFEENPAIKIISNIRDVRDFSNYIMRFDYIIASRYHAIVLSYKKCIPCLVLGWAVKYIRLAELFEQTRYVFDVTQNIDIDMLLCALDHMDKSYGAEKKRLETVLKSRSEEWNAISLLG